MQEIEFLHVIQNSALDQVRLPSAVIILASILLIFEVVMIVYRCGTT